MFIKNEPWGDTDLTINSEAWSIKEKDPSWSEPTEGHFRFAIDKLFVFKNHLPLIWPIKPDMRRFPEEGVTPNHPSHQTMSVSIEPYGDLGIPHSKNPTKVCSAIRLVALL